METFGDELNKLRKGHHISQSDLAKELGVTRQMVSLWERNICVPSESNLKTICKVFDLQDDYFIRCLSDVQTRTVYVPAPVSEEKPRKHGKRFYAFLLLTMLFAMTVLVIILYILLKTAALERDAVSFVTIDEFGISFNDILILLAIASGITIVYILISFLTTFLKKRKRSVQAVKTKDHQTENKKDLL